MARSTFKVLFYLKKNNLKPDGKVEKTVADAILDRLVHHSLRVELYGESIRKRKANNESSYQ